MALRDATLSCLLQWSQYRENTGTGNTLQSGQVTYELAEMDLTIWDEIYFQEFDLSATNPSETIDFKNYTNLIAEAVALGRIITLWVENRGALTVDDDGNTTVTGGGTGKIRVGNVGVANPVNLWWDSIPSVTDLLPGEFNITSSPLASTDAVYDRLQITDTHKNYLIEWVSGDECRVRVAVIGSTLVTG